MRSPCRASGCFTIGGVTPAGWPESLVAAFSGSRWSVPGPPSSGVCRRWGHPPVRWSVGPWPPGVVLGSGGSGGLEHHRSQAGCRGRCRVGAYRRRAGILCRRGGAARAHGAEGLAVRPGRCRWCGARLAAAREALANTYRCMYLKISIGICVCGGLRNDTCT